MLKSSLLGRSILVTTESERLLVLEIGLDCPECGQHAFRIAGHHLRTLRKLISAVIEENPDLVGTEESSQIVEQYEWSGPPGNPQNN